MKVISTHGMHCHCGKVCYYKPEGGMSKWLPKLPQGVHLDYSVPEPCSQKCRDEKREFNRQTNEGVHFPSH